MSFLGELAGEILGVIFPGGVARVRDALNHAVAKVVSAGKKFVANWLKTAAETGSASPEASAKAQRSEAQQLAEEEKNFADKFKRDGYRSPADADKIQEIQAARDKLREKMGETNAMQCSQRRIFPRLKVLSVPKHRRMNWRHKLESCLPSSAPPVMES